MNIKTLTHKDADWPNTLNSVLPAAKQLYIAGKMPPGPRIGVIGSRRPTTYGQTVVRTLITPVSSAGGVIVSGLAIGIDGLAHKAALEANGACIAVLPSGVDNIYPARHKQLAAQIEERGCLVSEYMPTEKARKEYFIARNRIIAALSDVLVVVEAGRKSGTMHTVEFALELGTQVAAVPGPIDHHNSIGTNVLIKQGATPITSSSDILDLVKLEAEEPSLSFSQDQLRILEVLDKKPTDATMLQDATKLDSLSTELGRLELAGAIIRQSDGTYRSNRV